MPSHVVHLLRSLVSATLVALCAAEWLAAANEATTAQTAPVPESAGFAQLDTTVGITVNCRYGVAGEQPYVDWIASQQTGIGWNTNFDVYGLSYRIPGADYANVIRAKQDKDENGNYLASYTTVPPLTDVGLGAAIAAQPGALWLVGNEPDRGPDPGQTARVQDDTFPQMYARIYHDVYAYIKAHDPTAQVANAGLVEVTPGRLQYLDIVWDTYLSLYGTPMPVDVWNMHIYVLPEANHDGTAPNSVANVALGTDLALALKATGFSGDDPQLCQDESYVCVAAHDDIDQMQQWNFARQTVAMRSWMKAHGQQHKPLILSEYGLLYPCLGCDNLDVPTTCYPRDEFGRCFTPTRAADFVASSTGYLYSAADPDLGYPFDGGQLVQQWLWYSLRDTGFTNSNLLTPTSPITYTVVGNAFRSVGLGIPRTLNLIAASVETRAILHGGDHVTATLRVAVLNNGTVAPSIPVVVGVYADEARTQLLASGTLRGASGCTRKVAYVDVNVPLPIKSTESMYYYVRVDPFNLAGESSMADNDLSGIIVPDPRFLFLPTVVR